MNANLVVHGWILTRKGTNLSSVQDVRKNYITQKGQSGNMTKTVLILPGCTDTSAVKMFQNRGWVSVLYDHKIDSLDLIAECNFDAICFMGGTDVDPAIYGEESGPTTQTPDKKRDAFEVSVFEKFKDTDVYLFGICRGAQLLNVLNGGKMIQECGYRGGNREIIISDALEDAMGLEPILTEWGRETRYIPHNVCHHQGMIAIGGDSDSVFALDGGPGDLDYVIHYPKTRSYGVQGHPEWGHKETEDLFFAGIDLVMSSGEDQKMNYGKDT